MENTKLAGTGKKHTKTIELLCYDDDTFDLRCDEGFDMEELIGIAFGLLKRFGVETDGILDDDEDDSDLTYH
jgi:hypothetical protein